MYAESREPAASTSSTLPAGASSPDETNTIAPTYAAPKNAQASVCHIAEGQATAAIGRCTKYNASGRSDTSDGPSPGTRTSLPGGAVVASVNRCRARRFGCADFSITTRSTPGRHADVATVGAASRTRRTSAG